MTRRSRFVIVSVVAVGLLVSGRLFAHHGGAVYDTGKRVALKGTVKQWVYVNPHCLLILDVKGQDGQVVQWIAETQPPTSVFPLGYRKDSFKVGDQVTITVEPLKSGRPYGRILQALLANGKTLENVNGAAAGPEAGTAQQP